MRVLILVAGVLLLVPRPVWSDIPGPGPRPVRPWPRDPLPDPSPPNVAFLLIEVRADLQKPRLEIPTPVLLRTRSAEPEKRQETIGGIRLHIEYLLPALALALGGLC